MNRSNPRRLLRIMVGAISVLGIGCAWMSWGMVCTTQGECAPGVKLGGVFCTNGEVAPSEADCNNEHFGDGPSSPWEIYYSTNYGLSMTSMSNTGILRLYKNGALQNNITVQFTTIGTRQRVSNPDQVQSQVESKMITPTATYSFELSAPTIYVSTSAQPGALVAMDAKLKAAGVQLISKRMYYIADIGGGPKTTTEEYTGPN